MLLLHLPIAVTKHSMLKLEKMFWSFPGIHLVLIAYQHHGAIYFLDKIHAIQGVAVDNFSVQ